MVIHFFRHQSSARHEPEGPAEVNELECFADAVPRLRLIISIVSPAIAGEGTNCTTAVWEARKGTNFLR